MSDFFQQLPGVIYELTIQSNGSRAFTFITANCEEILGISAKDIMNDISLLNNAIIPTDRVSFEQSSKENHKRESIWSWEGRILVNGLTRWIEARSNFEKRNDIVVRKGIILDITDRKLREQYAEAISKK